MRRGFNHLIAFFVLLLLVTVDAWSTLTFQLAGHGEQSAESCLRNSRYYCTVSWNTNEEIKRRASGVDKYRINELAALQYQQLNWFNIRLSDNSNNELECCAYQESIYRSYAGVKGWSPDDYMRKMSDYRSYNKQLIAFHSRVSEQICLNVILGLNFGTDYELPEPYPHQSIVREGRPFVLVPQNGTDVYVIGSLGRIWLELLRKR